MLTTPRQNFIRIVMVYSERLDYLLGSLHRNAIQNYTSMGAIIGPTQHDTISSFPYKLINLSLPDNVGKAI